MGLTFLPVAILSLIALLTYYLRPRNSRPLPPGPAPLPIIGNIHQAPKEYSWKQFHEWTKQYGPIFKLQFGKDTIIVLGNYEAAHALLNQRSSNFSSRPFMPMAGVNLTKGMHLLLRPYDESYKLHKRMEAPVLNITASRLYAPIQDMESCQLLKNLFESNDFAFQMHRFSASVAYSLIYGFRIATGKEIELKKAHEVQKNAVECLKQGEWIVDAIPILNNLPIWLAPWKRLAEGWFKLESGLHKSNMAKALASAAWNWTKHLAASKEAQGMSELEFAYDLGILSDAALDTTGQTLEIFVMAAVKHPNAVAKVQEELSSVVGQNRLPEWDDMENMPFVNAFINEVLRWRPIIIGGMPHSNLEEDTYLGYRIPKGSIVVGSHWSIHMDEKVFADPQIFRPERWIENPDLPNVSFGFGRRVCTGQHIARHSLFFVISRVLWGFNIELAADGAGAVPDLDDMALTDFIMIRPKPFKVKFVPRHIHTEEVVEEKWRRIEKDVSVTLNSIYEKMLNGRQY